MIRATFLAVAGLALLGSPVSADDVAIGGLMLAHDAEVWQVGSSDRGHTITCKADVCLGAVIGVTVTEGSNRCDERVTYERMKEVFPGADSYAVNMHDVGGLAIYFGEAGGVWRYEVGDAVFACLDREGVRYEFASLDRPAVRPGHQEAVVYALLEGLSAPAATEHTVSLGDLSLSYTGDRWEMAAGDEPLEDRGSALLTCLPPFCRSEASLFITRAPAGNHPICDRLLKVDFGDLEHVSLTSEGEVPVTVTTIHSGCRAWSPPMYIACFAHAGASYALWTGLDGGCHRGRGFIDEREFLDLVRTLAPAE